MTLKILAIDDIRDNLTVLKAVIEDAFPKAAVYAALNGKDGIALASTVDPDVILLDIIMPVMDGFEVCRRMKQNDQLRHIPVVFLTALKTSAESRIKALEVGADGFLSKPVEREELIAGIRAMVKIKAAEERKKTEKEQLKNMVAERTAELEEEIKLRINTEQELRESEEKYRTAFKTIPSAAAISKLDSTYMDINEGFTIITGYTKEDVVGKTATELGIWAMPEDRDKLVAELKSHGHVDNMEALFRCKDGNLKTGLLSANLITIQGEPYILSITHDITARKTMEQELFESEEKYRTVSNLTSDYIFQTRIRTDGTSEKAWVAGSFEQITGYPLEEYISRGGWQKLLHPDDVAKDRKSFEKLMNNQKVAVDLRIIHKNGKIIWIRSSRFPVWDHQKNRLTGIIGAVKDITEEKIHRQMQEILFGVTKKILMAKNLPVLFAAVQQEMNKVMDAGNFMVAQWDEASQTFTAKFGRDKKDLITKYQAKGTLSLKTIKQKKPLFLLRKDILKLAEKGEITPKGTIPEVWMGTPLFQKERIYGLMMVQHYQNPGAYDKLSFQIFEAVANELSVYLGRKETEEKNASLSRAIQQSPIATLITDPEGNIQFVNLSFCEIAGYTKEELLGQNARLLKPEKYSVKIFTEIAETLEKSRSWYGEILNKKKNGDPQWVNTIISPLFDNQGNINQLVTSLEDITERKRSHQFQEIQFSIAHSMVTSSSLNELFLTVKDALNKIIYAKNFSIALYDSQTNTLTAQFGEDEKGLVDNIPPERSLSGRVIKAEKPLLFTRKEIKKLADEGEIDLVGKRSEVWLGAPLIIKNKVLGVIFVQSYDNPGAYDEKAVEIMGIIASQLSLYIEQKQTEEFNQKLSKAVEQSPAVIVITDTEGIIEYVNPKFAQITGYTPQEALGQNSRILKSGEHGEAFYKRLWDTVLAGKEWNGEFHNKKKNGELYWESALISPIFNDAGEITHLIGVKEDITEKKKMVAELISAKDKAEESDRLKTAFLQNMSHEIRTPLNGILGFADLLTGDIIDINETKTYAEYIRTSGNRLLSLINNILNLSRIEAGSISVRLKPFLINRLMKEAWRLFQIEAKKKDIRFKYHLPLKDDKSILVSDENKINQVIINLLGNAFKFTGSGSIDFGYKISEDELLFWVTDTGRGIAPEHQERIFERFYQADMSISRDFEGAGLGLPISKGLVELLGGTMWLESQVDKGTSFYFTLPYHATNKRSASQTNDQISIQMENKKQVILIVEDDETSFLFLEIVLRLEKLKIWHSTSGQGAIEMCRNQPEISLVLMDIKLPDMNGLEATRKIKAFRPDLPVIAQTAHVFSSDRQEALDAGCDDFITKPTPKNELVKIIAKYLG
ncbi:MAG: hypothetical protein IEMM0006_0704 [bacterium]|nr:MAG: hypothetical protein IEMM0006_0704 [bacterium]